MLRGIWRLSGLASSQTSPSLVSAEENSNKVDPQDSNQLDQMEELEIGNEVLATEDVVTVGSKKAKSKHKAKKSKKASKTSTGETWSQELAEMESMENNLVAGGRTEDANGDLPKSSRKAKKKALRRTKSANTALDDEMMDHTPNENDDSESTKAATYNNATTDDLAQLPRKIKKAKRMKSRHLEDSPNGSSQLENEVLQGRIVESEDVQEDAQQPSDKALGKRKAVDEPAKQGPKKRVRKSRSRETNGQDLRDIFPRQSSSEPLREQLDNVTDTRSSKRNSKKRSKSTVSGLAEAQTQDKDDDNQNGQDIPEERSELPFEAADLKASKTHKRRKRRMPVDDDESVLSGQQENSSQLEPGASLAKIPRTPKSTTKDRGIKRTLTVEDTRTISQAIETYREINGLTQYQVNDIIQQPASSMAGKVLWKSLYEELPSIARRPILSFCRRNFHNFEGRGVWTEEQDEELIEAYQRNPNKWKDIGNELNRFQEDVRDRWRNYLICAGNMKKDMWDKVEEEQLLTAVAECIHRIREERLRAGKSVANEEALIDWQKVSEKMNRTRSRLQCSYKWRKIKSLCQSDDENEKPNTPVGRSWRVGDGKIEAKTLSASEKLRLLRAVRDSGASREGKIPWGGITLELNETGRRMAWKVTIRKLKEKLPGYEEMKFKDIVQRLVDIFEASSPNEPEGFNIELELDDSESELLVSEDGLVTSSGKKKKSKRKHKKSRKVSDRMRRQEESTPEPGGTTGLRKSGKGEKRKLKTQKFLSEEKVVEDLSDDDVVANNQIGEEQMDIASDQMSEEQMDTENNADLAVKVEAIDDQTHETETVDLDDDSGASPNDFDNQDSSDLEDEPASRIASDTGSLDLDEDHTITANGFDEDVDSDADRDETASTKSSNDDDSDNDIDESVPEDLVVGENKMIYHRLAEKHLEKYFENAASESGSVSSDNDSVSSIPARVTRNVSIEL